MTTIVRPKRTRVGAPRLPAGTARTLRISTTITEADRRAVRALAQAAKLPPAGWLYRLIKAAFDKTEDDNGPTR